MSASRRLSVVALSVAGLLSLAVPVSAQAPPSGGTPPAEKAADLGTRLGGAKVEADGPGGLVTFIGSAPGEVLTGAQGSVRASAEALLAEAADAIGTSPGALSPIATTRSQSGGHVLRYQQEYQGIPVFGGEVTVQLDPGGATRSLVSDVSGDPADDTTPTISAADATAAALEVTGKVHPGHGPLTAATPKLWIYDPAVIDAPGAPGARLVWRTEVKAPEGEPIREIVLVDADDGGIALNFNQIAEAKDRKVCDAGNVAGAADRCGSTIPVIRNEGAGAVALAEANTAYDYAGNTYDYFNTRFGRDSLDDAGMALFSTVRHCETGSACPYANAFWSGAQMHYGEGYAAADDVVGHELAHGVTEFSSGLFYYYQSGAINEALSDIFGEYMDLTNGAGNDTAGVRWLLGEDLPIGAIRNMSNPPAFGDPDRMRSPNYFGGTGDEGGVHTNSGVANKAAVLMVDGGTFNSVTVTGIGIDKASLIWYEAATAFLTSGSDYGVLDQALVQACTNLIGTGGITSGNCQQVGFATDATEMHLSPTVTGATAEAPVCAAGQTPTYLYNDDFEGVVPWSTSSPRCGADHDGLRRQRQDQPLRPGPGHHPEPHAADEQQRDHPGRRHRLRPVQPHLRHRGQLRRRAGGAQHQQRGGVEQRRSPHHRQRLQRHARRLEPARRRGGLHGREPRVHLVSHQPELGGRWSGAARVPHGVGLLGGRPRLDHRRRADLHLRRRPGPAPGDHQSRRCRRRSRSTAWSATAGASTGPPSPPAATRSASARCSAGSPRRARR